MKKVNVLRGLLLDLRATDPIDEFAYLLELVSGVISRRVLNLRTLPGDFLFKDIFVRSKVKEDCVFLVRKRSNDLFHVMPYYERQIWDFTKSIVKKGDVCIDVGAHIGTYTIPLARLVGQKGMIIAVEPLPMNISILKRNIKVNNLSNIVVIRKAAYYKRGRLRLSWNPLRTGMSTTVLNRGFSNFIEVEADCLDEIVANVLNKPEIKLLKVDVEGAEIEVLQGAFYVLRHTSYVMVEVRSVTYGKVRELLNSLDFIELNSPPPSFYEHNLIGMKR